MAAKIKRFLLRYDPPGVGLEIDDGGNIDVKHKDLPNASTVTSPEAIAQVVNQLIAEEPTLLTKRRHQTALTQLLGRLYQVELGETADEAAAPALPAATMREESSPEAGIQEETEVVLIGLSGKKQAFNGEMATVKKVSGSRDRPKYTLLLRRENEEIKVTGLEHVIPTSQGATLSVGMHVAIRGLRNHIELNGCLGRVVECHEESHRFEVRATESGQLFRVKQENLIPIEANQRIMEAIGNAAKENREPNTSPRINKNEAGGGASSSAATGQAPTQGGSFPSRGLDGEMEVFELGARVQLYGLKTAMNFNGQTAEVLSVDRQRCRYEIRLDDGSVKTIRAENVRLYGPAPAKTSPRSKRKDGSSKAR
jgi:hypothetical protein